MGTVLDIDQGGIQERSDIRDHIKNLSDSMHKGISDGELDERDPPVFHHFSKGVYCREMRIPAGTVIVGKIHKTAHLNIISAGQATVRTQFGQETINAPYTFKSEIGTQRVVFAHTDTVWTTIHPTELTDVDEIEEQIIAKDYAEIENLLEDMS
jgi:hypothetical protein